MGEWDFPVALCPFTGKPKVGAIRQVHINALGLPAQDIEDLMAILRQRQEKNEPQWTFEGRPPSPPSTLDTHFSSPSPPLPQSLQIHPRYDLRRTATRLLSPLRRLEASMANARTAVGKAKTKIGSTAIAKTPARRRKRTESTKLSSGESKASKPTSAAPHRRSPRAKKN
ncbi:hypothetical protein ANO11243_056050 [Dothideomycetidae sp. 11243]|nr:hypothetical protein ANO11243_056050 [fungal sp. No.11243]